MEVVEIFESISGEVGTNILQGELTNFIRFAGCSVGCDWCDAKYSWSSAQDLYIPTIIDKLCESNLRNLIITGGEPFEQKEILPFLWEAEAVLDNIAIETSGYNVPDEMFEDFPNIPLIIDYKPKSANVKVPREEINDFNIFFNLAKKDVIKFPFMSNEELKEAVAVAKKVEKHFDGLRQESPVLAFSPIITEEMHSYELFSFLHKYLLANKVNGVINLQIHKILGAQ